METKTIDPSRIEAFERREVYTDRDVQDETRGKGLQERLSGETTDFRQIRKVQREALKCRAELDASRMR